MSKRKNYNFICNNMVALEHKTDPIEGIHRQRYDCLIYISKLEKQIAELEIGFRFNIIPQLTERRNS